MRRNPVGLRRRVYTTSQNGVQIRRAEEPPPAEPASRNLPESRHTFDGFGVQSQETRCLYAVPNRLNGFCDMHRGGGP